MERGVLSIISIYYPAVTALKADGSTIANIPESYGSADISDVADLATNEFNDFYFRCEGQTFWLRTGKTGKAVRDVENRTFELKKKEEGGVYACVSGQEAMASAKKDKALRYGIEYYRDDYYYMTTDLHEGNGEPLEFVDDFIAGYEVKLKAWCKGEGYVDDYTVSENAQDKYRIKYSVKRDGDTIEHPTEYYQNIYAFDSEHITKSAPIVYRASAPTDQMLYGISSNKTDFMLEYDNSAYKKGRANIAFLAADTGVGLAEIKELPVLKWTRAVDDDRRYDYSDYATVLNNYYDRNGQLSSIENEKTYRIYARYFNPEDIESSAVGVLADLTAGDFSKEYVVLSPFDYHIPYDDSLEDESIITSYREGLVPDSYVDDGYHYDRGWWDVYPDCRFWIKAFSRDSMRFDEKVQAEGDFRIVARKVIEGEDEDRDKFLSANDIDEAKKYGCEVTEQYDDDDGWSIGEYDVLVFFYPNDETRWFGGVVHPEYSEQTRFYIDPTEINLAVSLKTGNGRYRDGKYIFSSGETISYEDLGFRLSGDTRKLDNKGESIPAKDIFDLDGEPEVYVRLDITNSDKSDSEYLDETLKPGESITLPYVAEGMSGYIYLGVDNTYKLKLKEKATGKDDPTYALITSHHGNSLRVGVVPKGTVSSALIKDSEITYGKVYKLTDSRKAVKYMKGLVRVSSNMTTSGETEDVTENSVFLFAAAAGGPFVTAEKLDRSVFAVGGKIYVRPSYLGVESSGEPIELTITTQPVYIEAAVPIEVDKGGTAPATYSKDIFVRDLDADGRPDSETYSVYKNGPAPITDWHNSDSAEVDSSGLDTSESGSFKLGGNVLKINLKEDKAASFAVRSTGAFFVVRSGGSVIVDPDDPVKPVPGEDYFSVNFADSSTHDRISDSQYVAKKSGSGKTTTVRTEKKVNFWYMELNGSGDFVNITDLGVVSTEEKDGKYSHVFDVLQALALAGADPDIVESITFLASFENEARGGGGYITVSPIPSVVYTGLKHVSTQEKGGKKSTDLLVSVYEVNSDESRVQLVEGKDYKLSYANNVNAGNNTGEVIITGLSAHKGLKMSKKFSIIPAGLSVDGITEVTVKNYYNYTKNGLKVSPVVKFDGKKLKEGQGKDYNTAIYEVGDDGTWSSKPVNPQSYNTSSPLQKFVLVVNGNGNYSGSIESDIFYGLPKGMKTLSFKLKNKKVTWSESKQTINALDYWVSDSDSKGTNYNGALGYALYTLSDNKYVSINSADQAGGYYYIGAWPLDEKAALEKKIAPATTYVKVTFNGLKFSKNLFKLTKKSFDYNARDIAIAVQGKKDDIRWECLDVKFAGYLGVEKKFSGVKAPGVKEGELANKLPGEYYVVISGRKCYSGDVVLSYRVKTVKGIISGTGKNLEVTVNEGKPVAYNAGNIDLLHAPVEVNGAGSIPKTLLKNEDMSYTAVYQKSKKTGSGKGVLKISNICDKATGKLLFKNALTVTFDLDPCSLDEGIKLYQSASGDVIPYGAIRPLPVEKEVKAPRLYLEQYGRDGWVELNKSDFSVKELKSLLDLKKPVDITVNGDSKQGARFSGSAVVPVESYGQNWKKAKLTVTLSQKEYKYTGAPISVNDLGLSVKDKDGKTVDPGNYDVELENNINLTYGKDLAKAIVRFKRPADGGDFLYGGTVVLTFKIVRNYSGS